MLKFSFSDDKPAKPADSQSAISQPASTPASAEASPRGHGQDSTPPPAHKVDPGPLPSDELDSALQLLELEDDPASYSAPAQSAQLRQLNPDQHANIDPSELVELPHKPTSAMTEARQEISEEVDWDQMIGDIDDLAISSPLSPTAQLTQEDVSDLRKGLRYLDQLIDSKVEVSELETALLQINKLVHANPQDCLGLADAEIGRYVQAMGRVNPPPATKAEQAKGKKKRGTAVGKISFGSLDDIEL